VIANLEDALASGARIALVCAGSDIDENALSTLQMAGHRVTLIKSDAITAVLGERRADIAVIYGCAEDSNVHQLLRIAREIDPRLPILVVSSRATEAAIVLSLRIGADDVMQDALRCLELEARVSALLRRHRRSPVPRMPDHEVVVSGFVLDPAGRCLRHARRTAALSPRQFLIMLALMRAAGRSLSREQLNEAAGLRTDKGRRGGRSLDTHIQQLRKIIETTPSRPRHILTVRHVGYRFMPAGSESAASPSRHALESASR
jgi:DNA-binding response OmpR family regulator